MKKSILILPFLIVFFSGCLNAQSNSADANPDAGKMTLKGLEFHTNLSLAMEDAKLQEKPVFAYFRSDYCGWCRKFEEETFTNQSVIRILNENFILVSIDVYAQKNETRYFRVQGTPAEIFLDSSGNEIKRISGYTETENFLNTIRDPVFKYGD